MTGTYRSSNLNMITRDCRLHCVGGCLSAGAEFANGIFNSHRNPVIYCGESDFKLSTGDILRTDYLSYLDGYPGHQSRNAVIGSPSAQQRSDYGRYIEVYQEAA
ncbi:MAG: hypothetical protein MPJ78_13885 [Hyphomicrobiaceae bacterium]|nr:hypothetical protein [Hyphomicrobiaceae bacterium]